MIVQIFVNQLLCGIIFPFSTMKTPTSSGIFSAGFSDTIVAIIVSSSFCALTVNSEIFLIPVFPPKRFSPRSISSSPNPILIFLPSL